MAVCWSELLIINQRGEKRISIGVGDEVEMQGIRVA
jgi:hypothetical protein